MAIKITQDIVESYLSCKYKGHLKLTQENGTISDYEAMVTAARAASRGQALAWLVVRFGEADTPQVTAVTADLLKEGAPIRLDACLEDEHLSFRFDALKRSDGPSELGDHYYVPVFHSPSGKVGRQQRVLLAVLGLMLGRVQGRRPTTGLVVRGPEGRLGKVLLDRKLYRQAEQVLNEIQRLQEGGEPPRLNLNEHCQVCEFRQRCRKQAEQVDDVSLLAGLSAKQTTALHRRGIFTVGQYSYTFRPARLKRLVGKQHDHSLQALAVREQTVYVAERPALPDGQARLYLDLEGLPDQGFIYLIGLTILEGESGRHLSLWADGPADERSIWSSFLAEMASFEGLVGLASQVRPVS
jgi:predicted RecB family nuclease